MKITAEFNSNEELLSFINTFGAKNIPFEPKQGQGVQASKEKVKKEEVKPSEPSKEEVNKREPAAEAPKVDAEVVEVNQDATGIKDAEIVEGDKGQEITKEMVRAKFNAIIQAGKQKEAKELVAKFGATKLPDVDPIHFPELMKEAEALL
jgi:hypothetical protein